MVYADIPHTGKQDSTNLGFFQKIHLDDHKIVK